MAKGPGENDAPEKLSGDIARSRDALSRDVTGLRYELDIPRKLKRSFRTETMLWISAAIAVGVIIAVLPARTRKVQVEPRIGRSGSKSQRRLLEAGFVLGALKIAAGLLRPVIVDLVRTRLLGSPGKTPSSRRW
jgi:hypothetical protein